MSKTSSPQIEMPRQGALKHLAQLAKLLDSQFRVPGTNIRFGLDGIIGLIPGAGDLSTFAVYKPCPQSFFPRC